jgi:hypothetical protein
MTVEFDLDLEEIYSELSNKDKNLLITWLQKDIYNGLDEIPTYGIDDEDLVNSINTLLVNRHLLSNEYREFLTKMAQNL